MKDLKHEPKKVLLAIPSRDGMISNGILPAIMQYISKGYQKIFQLDPYLSAGVSNIVEFRNMAANTARLQGYEGILFIDNDIEFSFSSLQKLFWAVEKYPEAVITATYPKKEFVPMRMIQAGNDSNEWQTERDLLAASLCYTVGDGQFTEIYSKATKDNPFTHDPWAKRGKIHDAETVRIGWEGNYTGSGFMYIPIKVLEKLEPNSSVEGYRMQGSDNLYYAYFNPTTNSEGYMLGEDYSFCHRLIQEDISLIILDTRIGHRGQFLFPGDLSMTLDKTSLNPGSTEPKQTAQ